MSKLAITFGPDHIPHPMLPGLSARQFLVIEGRDVSHATRLAHHATGGEYSSAWILDDGGDVEFTSIAAKWGWTEYVRTSVFA